MRIVVHDYTGHPGEIYMSRELARRGNEVLHLYAGSFQTPRGELERTDADPETFSVEGVFLKKPFLKRTYVRRQLQEIQYGHLLADAVKRFKPEVVLSGNNPLLPQQYLMRKCRQWNIASVYWVMDVYSLAVSAALRGKLPVVGALVSDYYLWLEKRLLRASDRVVLISEGFQKTIEEWGVSKDRIEVVPLWPPLHEIPVLPKQNDWSRQHGFENTINLIYAGTLGTKHNPETLVTLADRLRDRQDVRLIVISEGVGSDYLAKRKAQCQLDNLLLMPYQPYEQLPQVLATGDVLLVLLEPSAGEFSVPGKVLSNLCAGRPQVGAVPMINRAAKVIQESGGGYAIPVGDEEGFVAAAERLINDESLRHEMGKGARAYAEVEWDIRKIGERIEGILRSAVDMHKR